MQYFGKVLELRGVEYVNDKYFALVRLLIGEEQINFKWQLDSVTGEGLKEITEVSGSKFRLSLTCFEKTKANGYYSSLSKVTGEKSETVYFSCSVHYAKNINWINNLSSIEELGILKTTQEKPQPQAKVSQNIEKKQEIKTRKKPVVRKTIFSRHIKLGIATGLTVATLLGFSTLMLTNSSADTKPEATVVNKNIEESLPKELKVETNSKKIPKQISAETSKEVEVEKPVEPVNVSKQTNPVETTKAPLKTTPTLEVGVGKTSSLPQGYVALTFDDGPSKYTKQIVDILNNYQVGATFFFIGNNAANNTEAVKYAYDNGFSVANHSMTHPNLQKLSSVQQEQELVKTNSLLSGIISSPVHLFRPPYGSINDSILDLYSKQNTKTIMWNMDPKDWQKRNTEAILNYTRATNGSGGIYVFHEIEATVNALPKMIEHFQSQGLKVVSLK